jgi:hypothetical protein
MTITLPSAQAARLSFKVSDGTPFDWRSTTYVHFPCINGGLNWMAPPRHTSAVGVLFSDR